MRVVIPFILWFHIKLFSLQTTFLQSTGVENGFGWYASGLVNLMRSCWSRMLRQDIMCGWSIKSITLCCFKEIKAVFFSWSFISTHLIKLELTAVFQEEVHWYKRHFHVCYFLYKKTYVHAHIFWHLFLHRIILWCEKTSKLL